MNQGKCISIEEEQNIENNVPANTSDWASSGDDDIMQQKTAIQEEEASKVPYIGDKEPITALATEYEHGSPILQAKIKLLAEKYAAIRRSRGDGNCFYRCFMFSFLEHILETQDIKEVDRLKKKIGQCKKALLSLGYTEFTFEDFFELFIEHLDSVIGGKDLSISHDELVKRSRDPAVSEYVVMFFRFVTSGEIRRRAEFFEPFIMGLSNGTVDQVLFQKVLFDPIIQFCKASVEPMGEESDHVHIIALSDSLGVPIRVVYLDRSSCDSGNLTVNHHDFVPSTEDSQTVTEPTITMLYRPGHYDILYTK